MSAGRFQSRFFSTLSQQTLRWRDRMGRLWRQAKLTASWTVQITLYPIYVIFQAVRMANRQFQQVTRRMLPWVQNANRTMQRITHPLQSFPEPTADLPILNTLDMVRQFLLVLPPEEANRGGGNLLAGRDQAGKAIASLQSPQNLVAHGNLAHATSLKIRGIASLLPDRHLVLVTADNHCLNVLNLEQQFRLRQRIAWELADYWLVARHRQMAQRDLPPFLPPPARSPHALPPVRWFRALMGWMQVGSVAVSANLFHEARLVYAWQMASQNQELAQDSLSAPEKPAPEKRKPKPAIPAIPSFLQNLRFPKLLGQAQSKTQPPQPQTPPRSPEMVAETTWDEDTHTWDAIQQRWPFRPTDESFALEPLVEPPKPDVSKSESAILSIPPPPLPASSKLPSPSSSPSTLAPQPSSDSPSNSPTPHSLDYIETEASLVEYVKHPLEQLLQWLDSGMVWLENRIEKFWTWLRQLWQR